MLLLIVITSITGCRRNPLPVILPVTPEDSLDLLGPGPCVMLDLLGPALWVMLFDLWCPDPWDVFDLP